MHEHPCVKFLVVVAAFLAYLFFAIAKFGLGEGALVGLLSWSFFVFCTPIADAGMLLDFPLRLIAGIRMIYSEIAVWVIAFLINLFSFLFNPAVYDKTLLLMLFKHILIRPFPFWLIIVLSGIGTFLSVYFGDEILDLAGKKGEREKHAKHKMKHRFIILAFIITLIIILYHFLLTKLKLNIPLF